MLEEICPVQFVDGLNEGAELSDEDSLVITSYSGVGVQYSPSLSYGLTSIEIMLTFGEIPKGTEIGVELCTDYNEKPSDIILSSGSFVPKGVLGGWQEVILKPVTVIRNRKYWLVVNPNRCPVAFITAKDGQGCVLSVRPGTKWRTPPENAKEGKVMLKFYGRILPLSVA